MTPAPALTEATMDKMTVGAVSAWRAMFQTAPNVGMKFTQKDYGELLALCDLAKLALTPPQDVAALVSELRGLVERATSEQDWFDLEQLECQGFAHKDAALIAKLEPTNMTKLLDCVTSLSARNRELEAENADMNGPQRSRKRARLSPKSWEAKMNDSDIVEVMAIGTCTSQEHWDGLDEIHRNMRRDLVRGVPAALRAHGLEVVFLAKFMTAVPTNPDKPKRLYAWTYP